MQEKSQHAAVKKFSQIKAHILDRIESGEWDVNQKIPSENELAAQFQVSRMTARRAVQELTEQDVLIRTQGLGTFVADTKTQSSLLEIKNIADEINDRGHMHSSTQVALSTIDAIPPVAIALGVEEYSPVFHSILIHHQNNVPIQLEERFVNPGIAPQYIDQDFNDITPHEYLSRVAPLTEAKHSVEAIQSNKQQSDWLNIDMKQPCLQLLRRTWSNQGVVSFARLIYPGSRYKLGGHLTFHTSQKIKMKG